MGKPESGNRTALISVSDKRGLIDFARRLVDCGYQLLATGGTAAELREANLTVRDIGDLTGVGALMDGRVKTLSPVLFAGILGKRENASHAADLASVKGEWIDLVVCNFYPLDAAPFSPDQIDIGGPALVRAGAKNSDHVTVVVSPDDYPLVGEIIASGSDDDAREMRRALAERAWRHVADYDVAIARAAGASGERRSMELTRHASLRYGENPHQTADWWTVAPGGIHEARHLAGPALTFNNVLDMSAAMALAVDLGPAAAAVVKHQNPCGAAALATSAESLTAALAADKVSAYGGIAALCGVLDEEAVARLTGIFLEAIVALGVTPAALEILRGRKKLRVFSWPSPRRDAEEWRAVPGGFLRQTLDRPAIRFEEGLKFVTERRPSEAELEDLRLAEIVAQHARSNAIALVRDRVTVGIGSGQVNRLDAVRGAMQRAGASATGASLASDGFFPFGDGIEAAHGVSAIIQPGGSIRDDEVVATANRLGMSMCLSSRRHFRH